MSSKEDVKGACNCGAITVSVAGDKWPETSSLCHCLNCRASSSGLATLNLATPVSAITITSGTPKVYHEKEAASGAPMERRFCGDCGSPIMSVSSKAPELAFLKSGLFAKGFHKEGKALPKPNVEIYWNRSEKWEEALKGKGGWNIID